MTAFSLLVAVAENPEPKLTARQIIERRLGRELGPISAMPRDIRRAVYLLARQLAKVQK